MLNKTLFRATVLVAAMGLTLTGCATPAAPVDPTPAPSETSTEAPIEEPEPAALRISSESLAILDTEGAVLDEFEYFEDEVDEAVEALTDAFGTEPVDTLIDGDVHPDFTEYVWGAFALRDRTGANDAPAYPDWKAFDVVATAAEESGIAIATTDGISVGATADEVAAFSYRNFTDTGGAEDIDVYQLEQVEVTGDSAGEGEGGPKAFSTIASVDPATGLVVRIFAPGANFGE